jgi:hypothetical protein
VLLLPKIYCNLNNCLLRVINNDTYKEIPKVFNKVSPYTYSKNKVTFAFKLIIYKLFIKINNRKDIL